MDYYGRSGPWGPPYGVPPGYVPVPSGMDPEHALDVLERMEERMERRRKKADEDKKKDGDKKKETTSKQPSFSLGQVFMMMMVFGLPVGTGQYLLLQACISVLKEQLIK